MEFKMTLEERIKCIICASEIELEGEAYRGKYELNSVKSIKDFILDKLRWNGNIAKIYTNLNTNDKIILSHDSAGKLAGHGGEAYKKTLAHIPQIIEKMQFLEEMGADKENASFDKYSYYITPVKIDGKSYTILSTVGFKGKKIYYDQNVFEGTPEEVFKRINKAVEMGGNNSQYSRLAKILLNTKKR